MLCPPHTNDPIVMNWLQRHRGPVNFVLHIIAIPMTIVGVLLVPVYVMQLSIPVLLLSFSLFFGGFAIQFLGHLLEGSEPGEITLLRKWLSRKYPAVFSAPKQRQTVS